MNQVMPIPNRISLSQMEASFMCAVIDDYLNVRVPLWPPENFVPIRVAQNDCLLHAREVLDVCGGLVSRRCLGSFDWYFVRDLARAYAPYLATWALTSTHPDMPSQRDRHIEAVKAMRSIAAKLGDPLD